jgi:hypothetical protein
MEFCSRACRTSPAQTKANCQTGARGSAAPLYMERLAATTAAFLVRVIEHKTGLELFNHEIHLGSGQKHRRLGVDQQSQPIVFDNLVEIPFFIRVL